MTDSKQSKVTPLPGAIAAAAARGAVVLTPNRRLARTWRLASSVARAEAGVLASHSPLILSHRGWLHRAWFEYTDSSTAEKGDDCLLVLNPSQELEVWARIVGAEQTGKGRLAKGRALLSSQGAAREAMRAHALCLEYCIADADLAGAGLEETLFREWRRKFDAACRKNRWLTPGALPGRLAAAARAGRWMPQGEFVLAGFDRVLPALSELMDAMAAAGCTVSHADTAAEPGAAAQVTRCALPNARAEVEAAARWARALLEERKAGRIGVVVPDLDTMRGEVEHVFLSVLHPPAIAGFHAEPDFRAFNISAAPSLAAHPVARAALLLLRLFAGSVPVEDAGSLIRSPHVGLDEPVETSARGLWDTHLRRCGQLSITLRELVAVWTTGQRRPRTPAPQLLDSLKRLESAVNRTGTRAPADWVPVMTRILKDGGLLHPTQKPASQAYQAFEAFRECMQEFMALGEVVQELSYPQAIAALEGIVNAAEFQPAAPESPVQVLGTLEATGQVFDQLWVCGMDDSRWPPPPAPSPLIPTGVQASRAIHRATPALCQEFARQTIDALLSSAGAVVLSHAAMEEAALLRPSPLIARYPTESPRLAPFEPRSHQLLDGAAAAVELVADSWPALAAADRLIPGGTYHLRSHTACPFQAFARYRLKADPLEVPYAGFNALERGLALHDALAAVWGEIRTGAALQSLAASGALSNICTKAATDVVDKMRAERTRLDDAMVDLEKRRISAVLIEWLMVEAQRVEDFEVIALEGAPAQGEAAGGDNRQVLELGRGKNRIRVLTRADRVDRMASGGVLYIDYKTGMAPSPSAWGTDRPTEPQLPMYCVAPRVGGDGKAAPPPDAAGVAFAQVAAGGCELRGIADRDTIAPKILPVEKSRCQSIRVAGDWQTLCAEWTEVLNDLGEQIAAQYPVVDPRDSSVCTYCNLERLCRVGERPEENDNGANGEECDD